MVVAWVIARFAASAAFRRLRDRRARRRAATRPAVRDWASNRLETLLANMREDASSEDALLAELLATELLAFHAKQDDSAATLTTVSFHDALAEYETHTRTLPNHTTVHGPVLLCFSSQARLDEFRASGTGYAICQSSPTRMFPAREVLGLALAKQALVVLNFGVGWGAVYDEEKIRQILRSGPAGEKLA